MKKLFFIFISIFLFSQVALGKIFDLKHGKVSVEVPAGWREALDLYGLPLTILGPFKDDSRPIISVTATPLKKIKFEETFGQSLEEYKLGREKFIKKHSGHVVEFFPHEKTKWEGISEAHIFGYSYEVAGIRYTERTYYVLCKDSLFHLKSVLRREHNDHAKTSSDVIKSFKCI